MTHITRLYIGVDCAVSQALRYSICTAIFDFE